MKVFMYIALSMVVGFFSGIYWITTDVNNSQIIGLAASLKQQDKVLSYLEAKEFDAARRIQTEFIRLTLTEARAMKNQWPEDIQNIVNRREALIK